MQRIEYTQKPMRVPDRGCAIRRKLQWQRRVVATVIVTAVALLLASAVATGVQQARMAEGLQQLPSNVVFVPLD